MTITSVAVQVTEAGVSAPSYADILDYLQTQFQAIYGADVYLGADSQDGQLLAIFAKSIDDCNQGAIAVYNSFSPNTALGAALSNLVKINHIQRATPSNSEVDLTVAGDVGAIITGGKASDGVNLWSLPSPTTIPPAGFIIVTATCDTPGAVQAGPGAVNQIATPQAGWQSVTNAGAASPGNPVESDAALRRRQSQSTALQSETVLDGIVGSLEALPGVDNVWPYENDTGSVDANGLPAHSIAMVVEGGDATEIATTILNQKGPGAATYGTTTVSVPDATGAPRNINFFRPTSIRITCAITLHALTGYTTNVAAEIKQALSDYVAALSLGQDVLVTRLYLPALLNGAADSSTYELVTLQVAIFPGAVGTADLTIGFTEKAVLAVSDVSITVV